MAARTVGGPGVAGVTSAAPPAAARATAPGIPLTGASITAAGLLLLASGLSLLALSPPRRRRSAAI